MKHKNHNTGEKLQAKVQKSVKEAGVKGLMYDPNIDACFFKSRKFERGLVPATPRRGHGEVFKLPK